MKLIFIYGSPAVGKLTIAKEIAARTDLKVFHNHLTIDAVEPIFEFGSQSFWKLVHQFRIELIAEAARENVSLIFTFCYAKESDDAFVEEVKNAVEENGGEVCFVLLAAEKLVIENRVTAESRRATTKMKNVELLRQTWEKYDLFSPVPFGESLTIDNTHLAPEATAKRIIEHFKLQ